MNHIKAFISYVLDGKTREKLPEMFYMFKILWAKFVSKTNIVAKKVAKNAQ